MSHAVLPLTGVFSYNIIILDLCKVNVQGSKRSKDWFRNRNTRLTESPSFDAIILCEGSE